MQKKNSLLALALTFSLTTFSHAEPSTIFPAEIVGRNLNLAGFRWAGHVGITTGADISEISTQVIEVMCDTPVIQINPILQFKLASIYWGSRYGISDRGEGGTKIIKEANFQRGLCPIYTSTAAFEPGSGYDDEGKPTHCAVFRCDTFINYVFHAAGYDLPTYNSFTLPVTVFSSFPKGHGDGPLAKSLLANNPQFSPSSINHLNAKQLAEMNYDEFLATIDLPANKLTQEIIDKTWNFANDSSLGAEKQTLIIDYLGLVGSVDLIPKFIDFYSKVDNVELKSMLLRSTFTLHQKFSWLKNHPQERANLQKFYAELLNKELTGRDAELVLRGFINLSSNDVLHSKIEKIQTLISNQNSNASVELLIELSMKSKELETKAIPEIINLLSNENNPDLDDLFNQFIVRKLSKSGINALKDESKNQISSYLQSIAFRYSTKAFRAKLNAPYAGAWLEASALVNSNSLDEAMDFVTSYIQNKSTQEQATYINGLLNSTRILNERKVE